MFKELIEYGKNIKEKMNVTLSEIKKNLQGTISERKEARIQINDLERKEEINIQPEQQEETRIQKTKERIQRLWDISKHTNIQVIGMPEEKRKSKKSKTYLKKMMKENFPHLAKEIDIQVQEAQRGSAEAVGRLKWSRAVPGKQQALPAAWGGIS